MTGVRNLATLVVALIGLITVAAGCGGVTDDQGPIDQAEAEQRLEELAQQRPWLDMPIGRKASVAPGGTRSLADTLPDIDEFPLLVDPSRRSGQTVAEIFVSTEKSGTGTDGWMVEAARSFNDSNARLADGSDAKVAVRKIASGTAYEFIAAGHDIPAGFSPSNGLWIRMAGTHSPLTVVTRQTVPNVAGIVMKDETAVHAGGTAHPASRGQVPAHRSHRWRDERGAAL